MPQQEGVVFRPLPRGKTAAGGHPPVAEGAGERALLVTIALSTMLAPLNSTMIAVALPDISVQFGVGGGEAGWLVVGYLIVMAVVQPIAGGLGDAYGRRRIVLGALIAFLLTSLAAMAAPSFPVLVALRLGQAFAGALAIPNGMALARECIPAARRGAALGLVGAATGLAAGLGPALGGLLVGLGGWRAMFAANLPVCAAALVFGWLSLPRSGRRPPGGRFDLGGAVLLAAWLSTLVLAVSALWETMAGLSAPLLTMATVVLLAALVWWERRAARPVVSLALFQAPAFAAAAAATALGNLAMYATLLALPQFLSQVQQRPSAEVGAILSALFVPHTILAPLAGRLADRWGRGPVALAGSALTVVAFAPLPWIGSGWPAWLLVLLVALAGCGLALQTPAVQAAAIESVPVRQAGMASGVLSTSRYLGSIVGSAALAVFLGTSAVPSEGGIAGVFSMVEVAALGALMAAVLLQRVDSKASPHE